MPFPVGISRHGDSDNFSVCHTKHDRYFKDQVIAGLKSDGCPRSGPTTGEDCYYAGGGSTWLTTDEVRRLKGMLGSDFFYRREHHSGVYKIEHHVDVFAH